VGRKKQRHAAVKEVSGFQFPSRESGHLCMPSQYRVSKKKERQRRGPTTHALSLVLEKVVASASSPQPLPPPVKSVSMDDDDAGKEIKGEKFVRETCVTLPPPPPRVTGWASLSLSLSLPNGSINIAV
jgi:hypothetical protein